MADFTQNISNSVSVFGLAATTKWNAATFGVSNWGEGTEDMTVHIGKYLSNSQVMTSTIGNTIGKLFSNSISPTSDPSEQQLTDGSGYNYVFKKPTTDGEDRNLVDWNESDSTVSTWTCAAAASNSWSEA